MQLLSIEQSAARFPLHEIFQDWEAFYEKNGGVKCFNSRRYTTEIFMALAKEATLIGLCSVAIFFSFV